MAETQVTGSSKPLSLPPSIVIVGGGAGGLVLATRLARKTYRDKLCRVTLVDDSLTHIWKPLLHEIAAGSLNSYEDELNYYSHAHRNHYVFQLGKLVGLNRQSKQISLASVSDSYGEVLVPARELSYDILILSLGSVGNYFGIPGVKEYCSVLDSRSKAEHLHSKILGAFMAGNTKDMAINAEFELNINIIGAGPTGVELASELNSTLPNFKEYGSDYIKSGSTKITLIEAGPSVLPGQSEKMILEATTAIKKMNIDLLLNTRVTEVTKESVIVDNREPLNSSITIWTTGVKAPDVLRRLDGLETNRNDQVVVNSTLQSVTDEHIYAIGDCAEFLSNGKRLAPRAQVAQQQAVFLAQSLINRCKDSASTDFHFDDKGTFVSLGNKNSVGTLLGTMFGSLNFHGFAAKIAYVLLYRQHQVELFGVYKTSILIFKDTLTRALGPKVKLH